MVLNNPRPSAPQVTVLSTIVSVFDGASPAAYADLDLSAVVGVTESVVLLLLQNRDAGGAVTLDTRPKGHTDTVPYGISQVTDLSNPDFQYILVATDPAGVIEWDCAVSRNPVQIWVVAFMSRP